MSFKIQYKDKYLGCDIDNFQVTKERAQYHAIISDAKKENSTIPLSTINHMKAKKKPYFTRDI